MQRTRAQYKYAIRYCRHHENQIQADILASHLSRHNFSSLWQKVFRLKSPGLSYRSKVGPATGPRDVCNNGGKPRNMPRPSTPHAAAQFQPIHALRLRRPAHLAPWIFMINRQRLALDGGVDYGVVHINYVVTWTANQSGLMTLTFDLLTLKVVSESRSRVTWAISVPILVFLGLSVLDLGQMYATDRRQMSDSIIA